MNSPYPYATCTRSPGRPPAARIDRAITVAHTSRSPAVYPTTVARPVVPDDACIRDTCSLGTANIPNG